MQVASLHLHLVTLFRHITKLVPRLVPKQECVEVPKEICARSKINPRKVNKPAIQKWCYTITDIAEPPVDVIESVPACDEDSDCSPGYFCSLEEAICKGRPGKVSQELDEGTLEQINLQVLVNSITVNTATCTGCISEGVSLSLEGERIGDNSGGLPRPVPCTTGVLNRQGR